MLCWIWPHHGLMTGVPSFPFEHKCLWSPHPCINTCWSVMRAYEQSFKPMCFQSKRSSHAGPGSEPFTPLVWLHFKIQEFVFCMWKRMTCCSQKVVCGISFPKMVTNWSPQCLLSSCVCMTFLSQWMMDTVIWNARLQVNKPPSFCYFSYMDSTTI